MTPFDALLVLSFGGPEGMDDVIPFLENVLRGRNVPRERLNAVAHHYELFGGVSPITVSATKALSDAVVHTGDFSKRGDAAANHERLTILFNLAGTVGRVRLLGSAAQDFAAVACGRADALVLADAHPWDTKAGALLVLEAGGILSHHRLSVDQRLTYVLAANGSLHPSLADVVA